MGTFFAVIGIIAGAILAPIFTLGVVLICFGWVWTGIICIIWSLLTLID